MGLMSGISTAFRAVANAFEPGAPRDMSDPQFWDSGPGLSIAGVPVTDRTAGSLGSVQAVRNGLTMALLSLPVSVYRRGENGAREVLPDHPLTQTLGRRPNGRCTPAEFMAEIGWHLSWYRNAYCAIGAGRVTASGDYYAIGDLEILHPRRFAGISRGTDGHLYYTFNPPSSQVAGVQLRTTVYRDDQIWHLRGNPLSDDGMFGVPIWESARNVFARAIAVYEYGNIWFANNGQSGGIIRHPGDFKDKEEKQKFLDTWRSSSTGRNRHRDRLLTHGAMYDPIKVTNQEAQLLETEKAADTAIFGLWTFPPHRAGRLERSTNSNIEQQSLDFVVCCLAPLAIQIEQAAERDLLLNNDDDRLFVEFNFAGLLRGDLLNRYRAYLIGRQGEWLSANDILRWENMSPRTDPGGDEYKNPQTKNSGADGNADTGNAKSGNKENDDE